MAKISIQTLKNEGPKNGSNPDSVFLMRQAFNVSELYYIYGSSELSDLSNIFHPSHMLGVLGYGKTPFIMGAGGHQSLASALNIMALNQNLNGKKLVFLVSPQWFEWKQEKKKGYFDRWFHLIQGYEMLKSEVISKQHKKTMAKRLADFEKVKEDLIFYAYLLTEIHELDTLKKALQPLFDYEYKLLLTKERAKIKDLPSHTPLPSQNKITMNMPFADIISLTEKNAKESSTNNVYNINDQYYNQYIKKDLRKFKNRYSNKSLENSREYGDLILLMETLKELQADALFLMLPYHGAWCDYAGLKSSDRKVVYDNVSDYVSKHGFKIANYELHEYDPFFLSDIMHIGGKGWAYINRDIRNFYEQN